MVRARAAADMLPAGIRFRFVHASGPGGQHVNKVATAVQLRFDVRNSPSLSDAVRDRLMRLAANRIAASGELVIEARRFRSQERNRQDALARLAHLIEKAGPVPRVRHKTRRPAASKQRRLQTKRRRSIKKQLRARPRSLDERP